ncbi:DUF983 domain-containing protein [Flavitalea antarctica]
MNTKAVIEAKKNQVSDSPENGIVSLFSCKCPRCRQGKMFISDNPWMLKTTMKMNQTCPVCAQPFNLEPGFYYGSSYVSYALSIAISVATLAAWSLTIGISTTDNRFFYWMIINIILLIFIQPYLMRVARTGWLAFFVRYDRDWQTNPVEQPERVNREQENNW